MKNNIIHSIKSFLLLLTIYLFIFTALTGFKTNHYHYKNSYNNNHRFSCNDTAQPSFLVISDIHLYGSLQQHDTIAGSAKTVTDNGDSGSDLWDSTKIEIRKLVRDNSPAFIIVLGDLQRHNLSIKNDTDSNFENILNFFDDTTVIPATIPVVYAAGNNDSWNGDYGSFSIPGFIYTNYGYPYVHVYPTLAATHACIANDSLQKDFDCFSMYPLGTKNKLKLIVLNTVVFTLDSNYSTNSSQQNIDAGKQLNWLRSELAHTKSDENILIAMHIPPGMDGYMKTKLPKKYLWDESLQFEDRTIQNAFIDITDSFKNIIGLLASHSHMDGIRLLQEDSTAISSLLISGPGIAPGHRNNPAMKIITYNPKKNFELEDFTTYYMKYWINKDSGSLKPWDSLYTFHTKFHSKPGTSILATIKDLFAKDKNKLESYTDSIYTAGNGPSKGIKNDVGTTIFVTKQ